MTTQGNIKRGIAVITGASSGIGAATARALAGDGWRVAVGARREQRIEQLASEIDGEAHSLDVTDPQSVREFAAWVEGLGGASVLINNAGGAKGLDPIEQLDEDKWRWMYETNVLGTARVTKAFLPQLRASGQAHIAVVTSIAGIEAYPGGSGYNAAKFGESAFTRALRLELVGENIRVTEILPGLVRTEFGLVRFGGDEDKAEAPYKGITPLTGDDVAECIRWAVSLPFPVNIDRIEVKPVRQASSTVVSRDS